MTPKAVRDFILWMRRERIQCTTLTIGNVTIDGFVDAKAVVPQKPATPDRRLTIFEQYAGDLLKAAPAPNDIVPEEAMVDD